ncbi:MAG: type II secretion system protein [Candidatus Doudnabacteria bacterium]|nr:type II secretion system protein [Candidatus Doudnabacteria bacterium]
MNKESKINENKQSGFTLMEITVATSIFAVVMVSLLSLFNYVLKINRESEALRQASQGMRNFVEYLVKEIRNGQIDYYVNGGTTLNSAFSGSSPCVPPAGGVGSNTYALKENKLGIVNTDNIQECFYFGKNDGSYVDTIGANPTTFSAPSNQNYTLVMQKAGVPNAQILNPKNLRVDKLMFVIRPLCDPFTPSCTSYGNSYAKTQPMVTILIKFTVQLPTGEQVPIYYQTSVSSNEYDIPNN